MPRARVLRHANPAVLLGILVTCVCPACAIREHVSWVAANAMLVLGAALWFFTVGAVGAGANCTNIGPACAVFCQSVSTIARVALVERSSLPFWHAGMTCIERPGSAGDGLTLEVVGQLESRTAQSALVLSGARSYCLAETAAWNLGQGAMVWSAGEVLVVHKSIVAYLALCCVCPQVLWPTNLAVNSLLAANGYAFQVGGRRVPRLAVCALVICRAFMRRLARQAVARVAQVALVGLATATHKPVTIIALQTLIICCSGMCRPTDPAGPAWASGTLKALLGLQIRRCQDVRSKVLHAGRFFLIFLFCFGLTLRL